MGDDGDARVFLEPPGRPKAGVISKIRVENFMCHSNLEIELGEWVNFITGQNGSGKSAILTALCVAFGCRAKGTLRASTLKDFIKTGCSSAMVQVYLKNSGEDAFKPEIYGDIITVERRISVSSSSMQLRDCQGRKVGTRKEELRELVEHFNIDVENPCVILSQDKSREFLHSGNAKDKFKFFFKVTLLQHVNDLLQNIHERLDSANALIEELECTIRPIEKELSELHDKIKAMEHIEELSQQAQVLKKKLAWAWVYDVDRQLREQSSKIEKLKGRMPACQAKIDEQLNILQKLRQRFTEKKVQIRHLMEKNFEVNCKKSDFKRSLSMAEDEKHRVARGYDRTNNNIQNMTKRVGLLQQEIKEMQEQHLKETQDEEVAIEANLRELQSEADAANLKLRGLNEEENALLQNIQMKMDEIQRVSDEIADFEKRQHEIYNHIRELRQHKTSKVMAFGGEKVIRLLRAIDRHRNKFTRLPIGPIGAHLTLTNDDRWAPAVENAIGRLLNAFIVTNHGDSLILGRCAKEAKFTSLQTIIYDFFRPRLKIPHDILPQIEHPTTLSVLESDNDTVLNVLVDLGNVERQVLVRDYEVGTKVTFEQNIPNLKEVHTLDGYKMFYRGSVQTVLPPNKKVRTGRLCSSFDNQIKDLEREAQSAKEQADVAKKRKREAEFSLCHLKDNLQNVKRRCKTMERDLAPKKLVLADLKSTKIAGSSSSMFTVDELHQEISKIQDEIRDEELLRETFSVMGENVDKKVHILQLLFKELCESAKVEINFLEDAKKELMQIESDIHSVEMEKRHYEGVMSNKVLSDINVAEAHHEELKHKRMESCRKASMICLESEIEALGEWDGSTPEQLSAQLNALKQRLLLENQQCSDSIEDLRMIYDKKRRKISRKQETYKGFREKLEACQRALELRWDKFQRNATLLKRQLTWQFNAHLAKRGIGGLIKVSYEDKTLSVEVRMLQDSSSGIVHDTRGLSGGERSFSTLCFALALHEMTEAPFRAMDEFDVFMDAVSRKISLDTLVDFALVHGSQWIFITPHDISMVKHGERIRKQQMAAPRS